MRGMFWALALVAGTAAAQDTGERLDPAPAPRTPRAMLLPEVDQGPLPIMTLVAAKHLQLAGRTVILRRDAGLLANREGLGGAIAELPQGTPVRLQSYSREGGWWYVEAQGQTGWLHELMLDLDSRTGLTAFQAGF